MTAVSSVSSVVNALAVLFLKQIIKRRPCILRSQTRRSRSLFLPSHANLVKRAFIPCIFLRNPLLHRLHALKPAPWIEVRALLARMQFKPTLGTIPIARRSLQDGAALRAARNCPRPRQIDRPRPKRVVLLGRRRSPTGLFPRPLARLFAVAILISMLPIFCRHKPSPSTRAYCLPDTPRAASGGVDQLGISVTGPECGLALRKPRRGEATRYNGPMIHEILAVGPLQCNCSIVGDETTREAMVIDPGDDLEDVLALVKQTQSPGQAHHHHPRPHRPHRRSHETPRPNRRTHPTQPERLRSAENARRAGRVGRHALPRQSRN